MFHYAAQLEAQGSFDIHPSARTVPGRCCRCHIGWRGVVRGYDSAVPPAAILCERSRLFPNFATIPVTSSHSSYSPKMPQLQGFEASEISTTATTMTESHLASPIGLCPARRQPHYRTRTQAAASAHLRVSNPDTVGRPRLSTRCLRRGTLLARDADRGSWIDDRPTVDYQSGRGHGRFTSSRFFLNFRP
ncbi:hypothetical protein GY45DRAFT_506714 [Cubamyces sp. BRFM 1775]|nr:hypothetical protein GY45DRAFT_506714 [Cubamyces sp. BRFM 1775]